MATPVATAGAAGYADSTIEIPTPASTQRPCPRPGTAARIREEVAVVTAPEG